MLLDNQHPLNRSISIALIGKPNVGKSSLVNYFMGFDLSVVTPKPQTTRNRFQCVITIDRTEIIFIDTPGIHSTSQEMNLRMNSQAKSAIHGADLSFLMIDINLNPLQDIADLIKQLEKPPEPLWIILTKLDNCQKEASEIKELEREIIEKYPFVEKIFSLSSTEQTNMHRLTGAICDASSEGAHLFPKGEVSNKNERFFAAEYIREQAFLNLKEELPYETAVLIDDFFDIKKPKQKERDTAKISATILVNRPSQRAIVVGKGGSMIRDIGTQARKKIEAMTGCPVHLNLHVKVLPKWFRNNFVLEDLQLPRVEGSARVWRKEK